MKSSKRNKSKSLSEDEYTTLHACVELYTEKFLVLKQRKM